MIYVVENPIRKNSEIENVFHGFYPCSIEGAGCGRAVSNVSSLVVEDSRKDNAIVMVRSGRPLKMACGRPKSATRVEMASN